MIWGYHYFRKHPPVWGLFSSSLPFMSLLRLLDDLIFALWIAVRTVLLSTLVQQKLRHNKNISKIIGKGWFLWFDTQFGRHFVSFMEIMYTCEWNLTNSYGTWKWRPLKQETCFGNHLSQFQLDSFHGNFLSQWFGHGRLPKFTLDGGGSGGNDPYQWWDSCGLVNQVVVVAIWWMIIVQLFQLVHWNTSEVVSLQKVSRAIFNETQAFESTPSHPWSHLPI